MNKIAVVPGSFDPVTAGHVDIIARAAALFDRIFVAVMENPDKTYLFDWPTRLDLVREAVKGLDNVTAEYYSGFLYEYADSKGACAIVKGLRSCADFEYEKQMALFNSAKLSRTQTVLMFASPQFEGISSSYVRERARSGEPVDGMVTPLCALALARAYSQP